MDSKYILISIYLIFISAITDFATYGISTAIFSGEYNTQSVFGNTKNALTIAQILGYLVGKFIGMRIFARIHKEHRIYYLMLIYVLATIPLIIFGVLPPVGQVIMFFLSSIPMVLFWGFLVFYIEGRNSTVIIIMIVYMALIMASGVAKTIGTLIMNGGISENWMPAICASVSTIICAVFSYLLYLSPSTN